MSSKRRISNLEILLKNHGKKELQELYEKLMSEPARKNLTTVDLISEISSRKTELEVLDSWSNRFGVFNTSVSFFYIHGEKRKRMSNILESVKKRIGVQNWNKLLTTSKTPTSLNEPKLLSMRHINGVIYFLIAEKGRKRTVLNGFNYESIIEPRFSIVVWNDSLGSMQVRGSGNHDRALKFVTKFLKFDASYTYKRCYIDNNKSLKSFARELKGKVSKVKMKAGGASILDEVEFTSKPTESVLLSEEYKSLKTNGFTDSAGGVRVKSKNMSYVLWVGYKSRTIWLRQGTIDETLLKQIEKAYLKYGTIEQ